MALTCDGNGVGDYCTSGYKWGDSNPFSNAGLEKPGPSVGPVVITYKFQDAGVLFYTHAQQNVKSLDFSSCLKDTIRLIFAEWESVAAISFVEKSSAEKSDITVMIANISQGGLGYPAFPDKPCSDIAGNIILNTYNFSSCTNFYRTGILHEIGHALGLGHVKNNVVMNPIAYKNFNRLQPGDIKGVQTIYGTK
jgi:predicted Zn-dependent protease